MVAAAKQGRPGRPNPTRFGFLPGKVNKNYQLIKTTREAWLASFVMITNSLVFGRGNVRMGHSALISASIVHVRITV
jgi:hypothetical protein